jgi:hypothetical protein
MSQVSQPRNRMSRRQQQPEREIARFSWGFLFGRALIVLLVAAAATGSFFVCDRYFLAKIPAAMVGKWGVDGGVQDGATLELNRNGTYRATVNLQGSEGIVTGRLDASAKSLTFISVNPATGQEDYLRKTIVTLERTK